MQRKFILAGAAAAVMLSAIAGQAGAVTISNGDGSFSVGIGANGELFDGTGFLRTGDGYDPISPGTPRDSWGLSAGAFDAYADGAYFGSAGITSTNIVAGANSAVATTVTDFGFTVTQNYSFAGDGNILRIDTAVTNNTLAGAFATFQRGVDWDIAPTPFGENVFGTIGSGIGLLDSSYNGFEDPTAKVPYNNSCLPTCNETGDLGGALKINLSLIGAGSTRYFTYYYGSNIAGQNVNDLIGQAQAAGADFLMAGQSAENGGYPNLGANSAVIGVSGGVPEPATWGMMLLGFFGLGSMVRRRRAVLA